MILVRAVYCVCRMLTSYLFFFFSSRRRHTRCSRDWSSDVCSSDLVDLSRCWLERRNQLEIEQQGSTFPLRLDGDPHGKSHDRSEERRVGKECRSRWSPYH